MDVTGLWNCPKIAQKSIIQFSKKIQCECTKHSTTVKNEMFERLSILVTLRDLDLLST